AANLITVAYYGSELPPMISIVNLPPAGVLYTIIVWPILWVFTEELVYLGFLLPRLEVLTRKTWLAVTIVIVFWGAQHLAIPFLADGTYISSRVIAAFAAISLFPIAYMLFRRRLMPFIGAHYIADLATAVLVTLVPRLG
ncbi:MAG: CPBP family glutamic-type intramembrane protease, partial [Nitrospirales bacterium]